MKILSLFDGMACGYEALVRAGIKIDKYYASEIDKYAIQVATKNHPDIIEIGDVTQVNGADYDVDLLIGGSPCQGFSMAGKLLNFDDPRSKLFFEYVRILKECKPKYFLLENVKMKKEFQDVISGYMGVQPIEIDSALVSGQRRKRLYRTNIPGVCQPQDKGILLKDILESNVDQKYTLTESAIKNLNRSFGSKGKIYEDTNIKANTLTASMGMGGGNVPALVEFRGGELRIGQATKLGYIVAEEGDGISLDYPNSTTRRGRVVKGKSNTLVCKGGGLVYDKVIRKLTPIECERLQTLPDGYTEGVSDSQRYKMLGNGWTVDVIAHIFSFIK